MRARQSEAAPVELTNRLPFKRVQFGVINIVWLILERYGRCRISSSVRRLMSKGSAPPKGLDCVQADRTISEPIVGDDQIDRRIAGHCRLRMNLQHLGGLIA